MVATTETAKLNDLPLMPMKEGCVVEALSDLSEFSESDNMVGGSGLVLMSIIHGVKRARQSYPGYIQYNTKQMVTKSVE